MNEADRSRSQGCVVVVVGGGGGSPEGLTGRRVRQTIRQRAGGRQETDSRAA